MIELSRAVQAFDADPTIGCIILTGAGRAFAAGADIKEKGPLKFNEMVGQDFLGAWDGLTKCKTPLIAAVNGIAFGGGCEIAMICDIIIASENAVFGQPEIKIGTIPGSGGTQRLPRFIGKSKAMELVLTGKNMSAVEAERAGLVSRVVPQNQLMEHAESLANSIASLSKPVVILAKESVNRAYETTLQEGLHFERRMFHSTFALNDQKEGMTAFINKRKPNWTHN